MASGKLGNNDLAATTNTTVYTAPAGVVTTLNVSVCNRNSTAVKVRLAIAAAAAPATKEYIEYDVSIPANGVLERGGLVMAAGELLVAYSDTANVSVRAHGLEE